MSSFGLTFLSRAALRQAERAMLGDAAGVRDEVGFLLVHQRYADRFFPGTSVLHTRLRYALFVPWILERLRARGLHGRAFADALVREETALAERLKGESYGVIGRLMLPEASNQPPSYVYWTALSTWGLVARKPNGRSWSRADLGALAAKPKSVLRDDDQRPFEPDLWPVKPTPDPPPGWASDKPLGFDLLPRERAHMAGLLRAIRCPSGEDASLLATLVGRNLDSCHACWDAPALKVAGPHRPALARAGRAAALSAVGRGAYAALVEELKERDGRTVGHRHRNALGETLEKYAAAAAEVDVDHLLADLGPDLPGRVAAVLCATVAWVRSGKRPPFDLLATYRRAEISRKGPRARLAEEQRGVDRRIEWKADEHPLPEPLHYRWFQVRLLLHDLVGA